MNKVLRKLKKAYKKIKYRDRLTTRFYVTFISISSFILFLGGTYSYFNIFEHENAAVITISKLKYMLTSTNSDYQENSITVSAGQTIDLTLNLKSLNNIRTRYALMYSSPTSDVKVYYDGVREQNVLGEISTLNSIIDIKLVIENKSSSAQTITFELKGGYLQNTLDSNISDKYVNDPATKTLVALNLQALDGTPDFSKISPLSNTSDDSGIYSMEDDYGTSYYFRGDVKNNYVYFANFFWRIIRINGDGSLRIIYDGTEPHANGESNLDRVALKNQLWNSGTADNKYVGYMYSPSGTTASTSKDQAQTNEVSSNIKTILEAWYKENIADKNFDQYVSDEIFCNDRSIPGKNITNWTPDTGLGYGKNVTAYGAVGRLMNGYNTTSTSIKEKPLPQLKCPNKNDAFTKEDLEKGNGKLDQKVGLITADEGYLAGGNSKDINESYYLYKGSRNWTISSFSYNNSSYMFYINNLLDYAFVVSSYKNDISPVINLKVGFVQNMKGNGKSEDPFRDSSILIKKRQITFNPNGGTVNTISKEVYENFSYGELPIATWNTEDLYFAGWYTSEIGGSRISADSSVKTGDPLTLYAHFEKKENAIIKLLNKTNNMNITNYNSGVKGEMYTFTHPEAEQTTGWTESERTDYRYIGNTPNNYIQFNNETWRIIGVFTVEGENGVKEQRIKIIRNQSVGSFTWDRKSDGTYTNEWPTSSLATMLNGDYVNKGGSFTYTWYKYNSNGSNPAQTSTVQGLNSTAKNQISQTKWYLGGNNSTSVDGPTFYKFERGTTVYSGRSTSTIGSVGLMYPSDYIYTYSNGVDNTCYTTGNKCYTSQGGTPTSGWLFNSVIQLTITSSSSSSYQAFSANSPGNIVYATTYQAYDTRPCVYLHSDIEIIDGDGTLSDPYILKS